MNVDPRHRNDRYDNSSIASYLGMYADKLRDAILSVSSEELDAARIVIERAAVEGKRIFAIGNGGSAAIAEHLCCDWTKGTHKLNHPIIDTSSMTSNVALYSAIANDYGFENVFSTQIGFVGKRGDVLVAISSSGNSANITQAIEKAHSIGMSTIGLSGFSGGRVKTSAQIALHVSADNYGIIEDAHQALMHVLAQYIASHRDSQ